MTAIEAPRETPAFDDPVENLRPLMHIPVGIDLHLGTASFTIDDLARIRPGMVLVLPHNAGAALFVCINGVAAARAEIAVVRESVSVRITELLA